MSAGFEIVWHPKALGFFETLCGSERERVERLLREIRGGVRITNTRKCRRLHHSSLWELKADGVRMIGDWRPGGRFVVGHAFRKKKQVLDAGEIRTAQRMLGEVC